MEEKLIVGKIPTKTTRTPRSLPVMSIGGKEYFVDSRLGQIRNVENPHDFIDAVDGWLKWEPYGNAFKVYEDGLMGCPIRCDGTLDIDGGELNTFDVDFYCIDEKEAAVCREIMEVLRFIEN